MKITSRYRNQAGNTLFPGNYSVFRNLSMRVQDGGAQGSQLPMSVARVVVPWAAAELARLASTSRWRQFRGVDEDRLELFEMTSVDVEVDPTTWWCNSCGQVFNGELRQVGIVGARCPNCTQRALVQLAMVFMCPQCHRIDEVQRTRCDECGDGRNVVLTGSGGRRREYRWTCTIHETFERRLQKFCDRDQARMVLKSTGGTVFLPAWIDTVNSEPLEGRPSKTIGSLRFEPAHADVVQVVVGRIPVADTAAFYAGTEQSEIVPLTNPGTGRLQGLVTRISTDAVIVSRSDGVRFDEISTHSLEHALRNAAPAVTGLTQDEFGAAPREGGLVLYDNRTGGTGGSRLLADRRLDRWLAVATELCECHQVQCDDACRGCLFLPSRLCSRANNALDRHTVLALLA